MSTRILQYPIFNESKATLLEQVRGLSKVHLISGNPEVLFHGLAQEHLFQNFTRKESIIFPDGIGTVICSKLVRQPVQEKIAGVEVMNEIVKECAKNEKGIYLLGAQQEVLTQCKKNLQATYPNLKIVGSHDGFFDMNHCEDIVQDIENSNPYALFVAMGSPRQELFITQYMDRLPCQVFMGVGGSFDIFAGKMKRAPKWMIRLGIEWLYRVSKEPARIKRLTTIPKFIWKVVKDTYILKNKSI